MRTELLGCALVLSLLGCEKSLQRIPLEQGIRGQVPVDKDSWAPAPGEIICASEHEQSNDPPCAKVGRNGSFELSLTAGTYWLCGQSGPYLHCGSLCPHTVKSGEVTEVDPSEFLPLLPEGQGFHGTSRGSFGEHGYLDVVHPLRVCVGPADTPFRTPIAELTCVETDRCGRYVLSVPAGSYRVLFAEHNEDITSDRQRCRHDLSTGQTIQIDRITGRGAPNEPAACPEGSTPDPLTVAELRPVLEESRGDFKTLPTVVRAELRTVIETRMRAGSSLEQLAEELQIEHELLLPLVDIH